MLVLSRRETQKLVITGPCVLTILRVGQWHMPRCNIRIGIEAPDTTKVWRDELFDEKGELLPVNPVTGQTYRPRPTQELET